MGVPGGRTFIGIVREAVGWVLLVAGLAMIFLPGPGLLGLFGGLALLSPSYDWAERAAEPVKLRALKGAAESVESWPRVILSLFGVALLAGCGVLWILGPPTPSWWPLAESWWLPGGIWTGITQIASAAIALGLIGYSFKRYHGDPDAIHQMAKKIEASDALRRERRRQRRMQKQRQPQG